MADPTQFSYELKEITEALVKHQGLTEGKWVLAAEFNFTAIVAGPNANELKPTAMVQLNRLQLTQALPETAPGVPVVDASKINPRKKTKPR